MGLSIKSLGSIAIVFVVAIMLMAFGANILSNLASDQLGTATAAQTETGKIANTTTPVTLAQVRVVTNSENVSCVSCNATGGAIYGSYTFVRDTDYSVVSYGSRSPTTVNWLVAQYNKSKFNISYTYSYDTFPTEMNVTNSGLDALTTFADWLPTLALVIVACVNIGVVLLYFGKKQYTA